jgi:hypothetical protein
MVLVAARSASDGREMHAGASAAARTFPAGIPFPRFPDLHRDWARPQPDLRRDSAHPSALRLRTGRARPRPLRHQGWPNPCSHLTHTPTRWLVQIIPPTSAPGLSSPRPTHASAQNSAHAGSICTKDWVHPAPPGLTTEACSTRLIPPTSEPGLNRLAPSTFAREPGTPTHGRKRPVQIAPQIASASCMSLHMPNQGRPPVLPRGLFPRRASDARSSATIPSLLSASPRFSFSLPTPVKYYQ